jgi:hypothetical protein
LPFFFGIFRGYEIASLLLPTYNRRTSRTLPQSALLKVTKQKIGRPNKKPPKFLPLSQPSQGGYWIGGKSVTEEMSTIRI